MPHGSRVKVRLTLPDGAAVDRIPAWISRATVHPGEMGAKLDGVHWDPPAHERHRWWVFVKLTVSIYQIKSNTQGTREDATGPEGHRVRRRASV